MHVFLTSRESYELSQIWGTVNSIKNLLKEYSGEIAPNTGSEIFLTVEHFVG